MDADIHGLGRFNRKAEEINTPKPNLRGGAISACPRRLNKTSDTNFCSLYFNSLNPDLSRAQSRLEYL